MKYNHRDIRRVLSRVEETRLVRFLYEVANLQKVSSQSILSAYLRSHSDFSKIINYNPEVMNIENRERMKAGVAPPISRAPGTKSAPDMDTLLRNSVVLKQQEGNQ